MSRKREFNRKYSPEFKITVIMDMRENHLSYHETVRKYWQTSSQTEADLYRNTVKRWERIYLEKGTEGFMESGEEGKTQADRERNRWIKKLRTI